MLCCIVLCFELQGRYIWRALECDLGTLRGAANYSDVHVSPRAGEQPYWGDFFTGGRVSRCPVLLLYEGRYGGTELYVQMYNVHCVAKLYIAILVQVELHSSTA